MRRTLHFSQGFSSSARQNQNPERSRSSIYLSSVFLTLNFALVKKKKMIFILDSYFQELLSIYVYLEQILTIEISCNFKSEPEDLLLYT